MKHRPAIAADLPVIKDTWARTFLAKVARHGPAGDRWVGIDRGRYLAPHLAHSAMRAAVDDILSRCAVLVGHRGDAPDVVWCWVAFEAGETTTLHYVWTRPELRRRGYGLGLLRAAVALGEPGARVRCSHLTPHGLGLLEALERGKVAA